MDLLDFARALAVEIAHMEGGAWKSAGLPYPAIDPATGSKTWKS